MKIELLLAQHFYNNREITLQGMGTFSLSPDFIVPKDSDKDAEIPDHAISFEYNSRATEDEVLISFIVQQTRKMRSLAADDLNSYLVLGKQFLNIGKPFIIEGIGMLIKNQQGELEFTKGNTFYTKMDSSPVALKEKRSETEISFASESKSKGNSKKSLLIIFLILVLGLIGTAAWYFLIRKTNTEKTIEAPFVKIDTPKTTALQPDTAALIPINSKPANDGYTFKVVFMETPDSATAVSKMKILTARQHKIIMFKNDSLRYMLAEPFTLPLSDTVRIKDSLNRFYYSGKGFIKL